MAKTTGENTADIRNQEKYTLRVREMLKKCGKKLAIRQNKNQMKTAIHPKGKAAISLLIVHVSCFQRTA